MGQAHPWSICVPMGGSDVIIIIIIKWPEEENVQIRVKLDTSQWHSVQRATQPPIVLYSYTKSGRSCYFSVRTDVWPAVP